MTPQSFTIPTSEVNRAYRWYWVAGVVGILFSHFTHPNTSLLTLAAASALGGGILLFGHRATARYVWVTLSTEGIGGPGQMSRTLSFGWHESVVVKDACKFGFRGVLICKVEDRGPIMRGIASIFIPEPVLRLESFRTCLAKLAPRSHPLMATLGHQSGQLGPEVAAFNKMPQEEP